MDKCPTSGHRLTLAAPRKVEHPVKFRCTLCGAVGIHTTVDGIIEDHKPGEVHFPRYTQTKRHA